MRNSLNYPMPQGYSSDMIAERIYDEVRKLNHVAINAHKTQDCRGLLKVITIYDALLPFIQEQAVLDLAESHRRFAEETLQGIKDKVQDFFLGLNWPPK